MSEDDLTHNIISLPTTLRNGCLSTSARTVLKLSVFTENINPVNPLILSILILTMCWQTATSNPVKH